MSDKQFTDLELNRLREAYSEQGRLISVRFARSAIPEDATEYAERMADVKLRLAMIMEIQRLRAKLTPPKP